VRGLELSIGEMKNSSGLGTVTNAIDQIRATTENHATGLRDVVFGVDQARATTDLKLREMASAVKEIGTATASNAAMLGKVSAETATLRATSSKMLILTAVSALTLILLIGILGYKAVT